MQSELTALQGAIHDWKNLKQEFEQTKILVKHSPKFFGNWNQIVKDMMLQIPCFRIYQHVLFGSKFNVLIKTLEELTSIWSVFICRHPRFSTDQKSPSWSDLVKKSQEYALFGSQVFATIKKPNFNNCKSGIQ